MTVTAEAEVSLYDFDQEDIIKYVKEEFGVDLDNISDKTTNSLSLEKITIHEDEQEIVKELLNVISICNSSVYKKELPIFIEKLLHKYIYEKR